MSLSLAEFASAYPSAGGCTHVATQLAGPKYGRLAVSRLREVLQYKNAVPDAV
jgi:amino acid transporter